MIGAAQTASAGLRAATDRLDKAAQTVASAGSTPRRQADAVPDGDDLATAAVDVADARLAVEANAAVLKAANRMTGRFLDILA